MLFENELFMRSLVEGMRLRARQLNDGRAPDDNHFAREYYGEQYNLIRGKLKMLLQERVESERFK
jgi:hypothetical protein